MNGGLETLVDRKAELSEFILKLQKSGVLIVSEKAESAPVDAKKITDSLQKKLDVKSDFDALSALVEQELHPVSYEHQEYSIDVEHKQSVYDYAMAVKANEEKLTASYGGEAVENEVLNDAQDAIVQAKEAHTFNELDYNRFEPDRIHQMTCFKVMYGQYMAFLLYSGEIGIN